MQFNNTYIKLPEHFYQRINPSKVSEPKLIKFNQELATELMLDLRDPETIAQIFSGNQILEGAEPLAQVYAGHQFGHFVPQLGDGRAILLGELIDIHGHRRDLQLKGSGRTAYSRSGDGRAWLGPVLREYIVSEAMHALRVPTTRSLAAVLTGDEIYRESKLPGAILTRVASSHIRIGTFEYFAARRDTDGLKILADYAIARHYPEALDQPNPYKAFLERVLERQAELITKWMSIGFVHGVMNTDNMSISGETIDYGPCAFMDQYDPQTVFSSIDRYGRYAYNQQANICLWNLSSLAQALSPLIDAKEVLQTFKTIFQEKLTCVFSRKLGLEKQSESDFLLVEELLDLMHRYQADFTLSFRYLSKSIEVNDPAFLKLFQESPETSSAIGSWLEKWRARIKLEAKTPESIAQEMNLINPLYIPRNHKIEEVIHEAHMNNDYRLFERLTDILKHPFREQEGCQSFSNPPENKDSSYVTFCGT